MRKTLKLWVAVLSVLAIAAPGQTVADEAVATAHAFTFESIDGARTIDLEAYRGRPVLIVNTASFCGFTPQYSGLEALWQRYQDRGVVVLGVPSNDFGGQEPKSEEEIEGFCRGAFNTTFPLTRKYRVKGPNAHAFYRWLAKTTGGNGSPRWNFHKVLLGADGRIANWFASSVKPGSSKVTRAIEQELERAAGQSKDPA